MAGSPCLLRWFLVSDHGGKRTRVAFTVTVIIKTGAVTEPFFPEKSLLVESLLRNRNSS